MSTIQVERGGWQSHFGWLSEGGADTFSQTFTATGQTITNLTFPADLDSTSSATFRILIAEVNGGAIGTILYDSGTITINPIAGEPLNYGGGPFRDISVDMSVPVVEGQQYVILFDGLPDADGPDSIVLGWNPDSSYAGGAAGYWFSDPHEGLSFTSNYQPGGDYAFTMTFAAVNVIDGTPGDDPALIGTSDDDQINGYDGHDYMRGEGGNDELNGGNGDDYLAGGEGDDTLNGDAGYDRAAYYIGSTAGVTVDLNLQGIAQDTGSQGWDTLNGIEHVSGTAYNDVLTGDGGDNWLWGSTSRDEFGVVTGLNNDTLDGGGGHDLLVVGAGTHSLVGGTGTDTVRFSENGVPETGITLSLLLQGAAQDTGNGSWTLNGIENLSGGTGDDILTGDGNANLLAGDAGNDTLAGGGGNDTLYGDGQINVDSHGVGTSGPITTTVDTGAGGNDTLEGGLGNDLLNGGGGSDTASYANAAGGVNVNLNAGTASGADGFDTLVSIENATGSEFDDVLRGNSGDNVLTGLGGNDQLFGNAGNDTLLGGAGGDNLRGDDGDDTLLAGDGNDFLRGGAGVDHFDGGANEPGWGNPGGIGDRVSFFEQAATQGVVADLRTGIISNDGYGNVETMVGIESLGGDTAFVDVFHGNDGANLLLGGIGDQLFSYDGDDTIQAAAAAAILDGGLGTDTLLLLSYGGFLLPDADADGLAELAAEATSGWTVDLAAGTATDGYGNSGTVNGIENVDGSHLADNITGDGGNNILNGGDGDDTLEGRGGDDTLDGGNGVDTASYANASGSVQVFLYRFGGGNGESGGADGFDLLFNIENLTGSAFGDQLAGNNLDNVIAGGDGHDGLRGYNGNDTLLGGEDDDFLNGGLGDDFIDGGAGIDRAAFYEDASPSGVTVDLNLQGVAQDTGQGWDTLVGIENVSGSVYGDTLTGDGNDNVLWGSASTLLDGTIVATNNDTISGGGGNDLLIAGIGNHIIDGGSGTDTFRFDENGAPETGITLSLLLQGAAQASGNGSWTLTNIENLSGSAASDSLTGDGNDNVLAGEEGDDSLSGGSGNDTLYGDGAINWDTHGGGGSGPIVITADTGAAGNDVLDGGDGDDQLWGGAGLDTASFGSATGNVEAYLYEGGFGEAFGAAGYDQLHDIENLTGSAFDDILFGNSLANVINGGDGHDFIQARGGDDSVYGGDGDDYLGGGIGDDLLDGGAGWDRVSFSNGAAAGVIVDLRLQGSAQNTGLGMDILTGIEHLSGTIFADTLTGDDGDNWLWGVSDSAFAAADTIDGQGGNDLIEVGAGDHIVIGGTGNDTFRYNPFGTGSVGGAISLMLQGAAQYTGGGWMTLTGFENLSGSSFDDALTGDGNDNVLAGASGNDTLSGGAGNDTLYGDGSIHLDTHGIGGSGPITAYNDVGAAGNDLLEGGLGDDHIDGGGGIDTATYANAAGGVNVNLGAGFAFGADGNDTLLNIENAIGSQFADTLNGSSADNVLEGLSGNDVIQGQGGNDTIYGGDGDDTLRGDAGELSLAVSGDDILHGGNGNDNLRGGLGDDQLYGGANNDLLRGNGGVDYFDGGDDDGEGVNGIGDRVSFYEQRATQGAVADLRTGIISNDGFGNIEVMVGIESLGADTAYADTFYGNDARNYLLGNLGDSLFGFGEADVFQLSSAAAIVDGGLGTDRLLVTIAGGWLLPDADADGLAELAADATAGWTVDLTAGTTIDGYGNAGSVSGIENVDGSVLADTITGDASVNVLNGFDGDDTLNGRAGNDTLDGGNGSDTASYANATGAVTVELYGGGFGEAFGADGNDQLFNIENLTGSAFNDQLIGDDAANVLDGNDGHDTLRGFGGNDSLLGGDGDDFLNGGLGDDTINGGAGWDRAAFYTGATAGVTVSLAIAGAQATGQGNDTLIDIEHVSGTVFNDVLTGNGGDNWLWGSPATLGDGSVAATNNDTLDGGGGNDLLTVGIGNHSLTGGTGTDTVSFTENGAPEPGLTISLALAGAQATGAGNWTLSGIENLSGGLGTDVLTGDNNANALAGDVGNDTLRGNDGNDVLYGDGRIFVEVHGAGSGPITTWSDVGQIDSGLAAGNDTLLGGRGDDYLYGGRGNDLMTGNQGVDRIVIEATSGADRVTDFAAGIDKIVFDASSGVDAFSDLTLTKVGNNTVITWGTADSIQLDGIRVNQLQASDFEFAPSSLSSTESLMAAVQGDYPFI